jgi:hypothetical protein
MRLDRGKGDLMILGVVEAEHVLVSTGYINGHEFARGIGQPTKALMGLEICYTVESF